MAKSAGSVSTIGLGGTGSGESLTTSQCPAGAGGSGAGSGGSGAAGCAVDRLARPIPEGATAVTEPIFDCIVFLIYCPEHEQIAVTKVSKMKCVWLPFVLLPEGVTWEKASHEGVRILIGRQDDEMSAEEAEMTAPVYQMTYLQIFRVQLPSRQSVLRLTRFVHLEKNPNFRCCQNDSNRVDWIPVSEVLMQKVDKVWGPELMILTNLLLQQHPHIIQEHELNKILYYMRKVGSPEHQVLMDAKMTDFHVYDLFTNYYEHCFPSFYMCFESFRAFFVPKGYQDDSTKLGYLFHAFSSSGRSFIDFHEFMIGILITEPKCTATLIARLNFIFRYYDFERKGFLTSTNIVAILRDIYPAQDDASLLTEAQKVLKEKACQNLFFSDFQALEDLLPKLAYVCRSPKSIITQILHYMKEQKEELKHNRVMDHAMLKAKRTTKGTCLACKAQQYEYGNHCVTIDTIGRCVEPKVISKGWFANVMKENEKNPMTRSKYSLEYVFALGSIASLFLDLVRDFFHRKDQQKLIGLMAVPDDWVIFTKYFRILCREVEALLEVESKLIKTNAPAIVIGDLQGSLSDLIALERCFFQSFPVVPEKLIFLGNYSGVNEYGVECLMYLFALKMLSPNKIFLLRGLNETNSGNGLQAECTRKYGANYGRVVHALLQQLFAKLPIAVLVDESILCLHSGIPTTGRIERLTKLPKDLPSVERDAPIAYEIITRYPRNLRNPSSESGKSQGINADSSSTGSLPMANVSKLLYGSKPGDTEFHVNYRSEASLSKTTKSKAVRSKSVSSAKSGNLKSASGTSGLMKKSSEMVGGKSLKRKSEAKSLKSIRSTKSTKTLSGLNKSNSSINKSTAPVKHTKSGSLQNFDFRSFKTITGTKLKPAFLKTVRFNRKSIKLKKSPALVGKSAKFPLDKSVKVRVSLHDRHETFDQQEFAEFTRAAGLDFVIRSHSPCAYGYKLNFENRCLTVFSCTNFNKLSNQAAVALIDASNQSVRLVRFQL